MYACMDLYMFSVTVNVTATLVLKAAMTASTNATTASTTRGTGGACTKDQTHGHQHNVRCMIVIHV